MSSTPRRQTVPVDNVQDRDVHRNQTNPIHEHTSLFHEVHETLRRLLQHLVFASLLALRLYMLPLLYLSHKLTVRDDPWYLATWNIMLRPGRSMADCTQCHTADRRSSILERWNTFRNNVYAPLRIFRTLYALGKVIVEDPNAIHPTPPPLLGSGPDSAIDVQSEQDDTLKISDSAQTEPTPEAPASASQIYHAALLNGTTLDDILAAFETDAPKSPVQGEHGFVDKHSSPHAAHEERLTGPFIKRRYRNVSIHTLSDRVSSPPKAFVNISLCPPGTNGNVGPQLVQSPLEVQESPPRTTGGPHDDVVGQPQLISEPYLNHDDTAEQGVQEPKTPTDIKQCPTFVRRHNYCGISKRSLSGDKQSLKLMQDRGTVSSPALISTSPSKRTKLQRRVKVSDDANKA